MAGKGARCGPIIFIIFALAVIIGVVVIGLAFFNESDIGGHDRDRTWNTALSSSSSSSSTWSSSRFSPPPSRGSSVSAASCNANCPHCGTDASIDPDLCDNAAIGYLGHPRANVNGETPRCISMLLPPLGCVRQSNWSVSVRQTPGWTTYDLPAAGLSCGTGAHVLSFDVSINKTLNGIIYLNGYVKIRLTNDGNCNATLSSLLLLLEQQANQINASAAGQPIGPSYGPNSAGFVVWAIDGAENSQTSGQCGTPRSAQMCEASLQPLHRCNVTVNFTAGSLSDINGRPLDLANYTVPAQTLCLSEPVEIVAKYIFRLTGQQYAAMKAHPNYLRLTALVSYDACCRTAVLSSEDACFFDVDCDDDGSLDVIRTTSIESDVFTLPVQLAKQCFDQCGCVRANTSDVITGIGNGLCGWTVDTVTNNSLVNAGIICTPSSTPYRVIYHTCCNTTAAGCIGEGTYQVQDSDTPFLTPVGACDALTNSTPALGVASPPAVESFSCDFPLIV
jgi:hypothetical protein